MKMDDNRVFGNDALDVDDEWGGVDYENLKAPTLWRFDKATGKLHMLFKEGDKPSVWHASAKLGEDNGYFRIATLASSQEVLLWNTNQRDKFCASKN